LVELGDTAEYDRFREALIARYAGTDDPIIAERVVKACLLEPAGNELMRALDRYSEVAERSLASRGSGVDAAMAAWRSYSLALMAYRLGNFPQAIEHCARSQEYDRGMQSRAASIELILAMAHARLGQHDQARTELAAGQQIIETHFPAGMVVTRRWEGFWFDWLIAQIHLREAQKLVR
jgi:hypothetical protein